MNKDTREAVRSCVTFIKCARVSDGVSTNLSVIVSTNVSSSSSLGPIMCRKLVYMALWYAVTVGVCLLQLVCSFHTFYYILTKEK